MTGCATRWGGRSLFFGCSVFTPCLFHVDQGRMDLNSLLFFVEEQID